MKDLTSAETIVMKTIWDADHEMSLSEIVRRANEAYDKDWKPQTVSTYLTKLVQKEFVRMHREGRFFFMRYWCRKRITGVSRQTSSLSSGTRVL